MKQHIVAFPTRTDADSVGRERISVMAASWCERGRKSVAKRRSCARRYSSTRIPSWAARPTSRSTRPNSFIDTLRGARAAAVAASRPQKTKSALPSSGACHGLGQRRDSTVQRLGIQLSARNHVKQIQGRCPFDEPTWLGSCGSSHWNITAYDSDRSGPAGG